MFKFIRRFRILPILFVAVIMCLVLAHPALAGDTLGDTANKLNWLTPLAALFSTIIVIIALLSIILAILLGDLMTSFYIFDSGMGDTLHLVWEVMRNFVNIVFILALLVIAVRVIFGIGDSGGTGFLKKILPKFIIALVAVNLTFFAARFVVGTADVLATAVFAIPKTVVGEKMVRGVPCPKTYANFQNPNSNSYRVWDAQACSKEVENLIGGTDAAQTKLGEKGAKDFAGMVEKIAKATSVNTKIQDLVTKENFALVLLMNILRLDNLMWMQSAGGSWQTFTITGLGSMIMAGAVGVVYFMLFVAFLIRVVILWIIIPLMPLGVLAMVMKEVIPGMPEAGGGTFSLKGFINTAMMPVFVAFPLSIGMVMIFGNNTIVTDNTSFVSMSDISKHFNTILWWAASIGVVWFGTKEAIKMGNEMAAHATDAIHSKVTGAVGAVAGTLKYAPIIPGFGADGGSGSANEFFGRPMAALGKIKSASETRKEAGGAALAKAAFPGLIRSAPLTQESLETGIKRAANTDASAKDEKDRGNAILAELKRINDTADTADVDVVKREIGNTIAEDLKKAFKTENIKGNQSYLEALKEVAKNGQIDSEKKREINRLITDIENKMSGTPNEKTAADPHAAKPDVKPNPATPAQPAAGQPPAQTPPPTTPKH
jgi:hypothetical protein